MADIDCNFGVQCSMNSSRKLRDKLLESGYQIAQNNRAAGTAKFGEDVCEEAGATQPFVFQSCRAPVLISA
jgi:hypothetical protein